MKLKAVALGTVAALALTACGGGGEAQEAEGKSIQIGIATIVSHPALDAVAEGFKAAMAEACASRCPSSRRSRHDPA